MTYEEKLVACATSRKLSAIGQTLDAVMMLVGALLATDEGMRRDSLLKSRELVEKSADAADEAAAMAGALNRFWEEAGSETDEA